MSLTEYLLQEAPMHPVKMLTRALKQSRLSVIGKNREKSKEHWISHGGSLAMGML